MKQTTQPPPGPLRAVITEACAAGRYTMQELTVLDNDPYRLDTPAGHRDGGWTAKQINRFVPGGGQVHLRGLHYLIASAGDVRKPDGRPYVNSDDDWDWMSEDAASAARWLGYVPFDRIKDARSEEAALYIPEHHPPFATLLGGDEINVSGEGEQMMPHFHVAFYGRQPYRIILITEKSSLRPILEPIAESVGGELLAMTGETSDTRIAELAARCKTEEDGPIGKILYRRNGGQWTLLATFEGSFGHEDKLFICEQALNKSYGEGHEFLATLQAEDYLEE